jgi:hypothetical protein
MTHDILIALLIGAPGRVAGGLLLGARFRGERALQ